MHMKNQLLSFRFLILTALLGSTLTFGQSYNFEEEFRRIVEIPKSPEAEAFEQYGNTPVDLYSGRPSVSVPIYTVDGKEIDLPISLSYDASGVRVRQVATGAGLSWNLNVGGRISRITNGLVDDYFSISNKPYKAVPDHAPISNPEYQTSATLAEKIQEFLNPPSTFPSLQAGIDYFKFLKAIGDNYLDTQVDYYSFNALGLSDTFVYDMNSQEFIALDNPRIKVTAHRDTSNSITGWTIIADDGTKFYFNAAEPSKTMAADNGPGAVVQEYNSSWALTKIESPNKMDTYDFIYTAPTAYVKNQPDIIASSISNELNHSNPETATNLTTFLTEVLVKPKTLTSIKHNNTTVLTVTHKSRSDFGASSAIDKIDLKKPDGSLLKRYAFFHSYFGNTGSSNNFHKRLKLDSIQIKSGSNRKSSYQFEYFSPSSVPPLSSSSVDYIGLYNGKNNGMYLYPEVSIDGYDFDGADRSSSFNHAVIGTLSKMVYPTGGYSIFEFEPNKTTYTVNDINSSTEDIAYGYLSLTGGTVSSSSCGACCIDQYGNAPKMSSVLFTIEEAGLYKVDFSEDFGSNGEAYIFKRSDQLRPQASHLSYDQVIDQLTCNELVDMFWSSNYSIGEEETYFEVGTYQITLAKGVNYQTPNNISLYIHREEITTTNNVGTGEVERAGFRIKNIKNYSANNELETQKQYIYKTEINGANSSGVILFKPTYFTNHVYTMWSPEDNSQTQVSMGVNTRTQMRRGDSWSGGDRPHVAYKNVFEKQISATENNGYINHKFSAEGHVGVWSSGVSPNANLYAKYATSGKQTGTRHFSATDSVGTEGTLYQDKIHYGASTIYLTNNPSHNYNFIRIYDPGNGQYVYEYVEAEISGFFGPYAPGTAVNPGKPSICNDPNSTCLQLQYSTFETRQTYAQGRVGSPYLQTSLQYYNGQAFKKQTLYDYDPAIDYLMRSSKTTTSIGDTLTTIYKYPKDYNTTVYNDMVDQNRLNTVIKTELENDDGSTLATKETTFKEWYTNIFKPEYIKTSKGSSTPLNRIQIHSYYPSGNPKEVSMSEGSKTTYLWGYSDKYPIAKIQNASYAQVLSALGGSFNAGSGGLTSTQNNNLRTISGALVTTYAYTPLVGTTTVTDPRGIATNYIYDEFNRLKNIKDDDLKLIEEYLYNYKY